MWLKNISARLPMLLKKHKSTCFASECISNINIIKEQLFFLSLHCGNDAQQNTLTAKSQSFCLENIKCILHCM